MKPLLSLLLLAATAAAAPDFEKDVAPLLIRRCLTCHNASEARGDLDLTRAENVPPGGKKMLERVEAGEMPPKERGESRRLPDDETAVLRAWVGAGAPWPKGRQLNPYEFTTSTRAGLDWWSLRPIKTKPAPDVSKGVNPIDAYILARLQKDGLKPAPEAERRTLVRRLWFDLVGLPPSPEEMNEILADGRADWYERLVDRLLASPRHGERQARFWLDLVRYADTNGYERDAPKPNAWKYRDYVIRSFNADKPYDRFIVEQLAGDELPDRSEETVIATGMLRVGTWDDEPNDKLEYKYDRLEDMVHVTTTAFLGVTVKCARCHDHKFDPIPQTDFYRVASAFWPGDLVGNPGGRVLGHEALAWTDSTTKPPPLNVLKKGDPRRPGKSVEPGFVSMIPGLDQPFAPPSADAKSTGRRLQLAKRIADPKNPLTARVLVNRIWQQHFGQGLVRTPDNFGLKGDPPSHPELLDRLAFDFIEGGFRIKRLHRFIVTSQTYRQASVHPEQEQQAQKDSGNRLLWRMNRRRLDAESLRDSLLTASASLNGSMGGPGFTPRISREAAEGLSRKSDAWKESSPEEQRRRAIYLFSRRSMIPPLMTTFDYCDTTRPIAQRDVTIVPTQALALLNNEFVHERSEAMAHRVEALAKGDRVQAVQAAWRIAFGRDPREAEQQAALAHLQAQMKRFGAPKGGEAKTELPVKKELVLWLKADVGAVLDDRGRVSEWKDQSGTGHHASQSSADLRPEPAKGAIHFDGKKRFMNIAGQVLKSQQMTLFAVVNDRGGNGHREVFTNWDGGRGNSTSSLFLGTTGTATVRFTDDFANAGTINKPEQTFVLSAVNATDNAVVFQNGKELARKSGPLSNRILTTPYVIGRQGTLDGEFWNGDVRELLVFDRALTEAERRGVEDYLMGRHGIKRVEAIDPRLRALTSLCHVLLNANEFMYID